MSDASNKVFAYLVNVEAGLSLDPHDPGNWTGGRVGVGELRGTRFGIAAASHPSVDIANLTLAGAQAIFAAEYWNKVEGDALPYALALCVADDAYNHGAGTAVKTLQHCCGAGVDGAMGPGTLAAVNGYLQRYGLLWTVKRYQGLRALAYAQDPNEQRYGEDWFRERVVGTAMEAARNLEK